MHVSVHLSVGECRLAHSICMTGTLTCEICKMLGYMPGAMLFFLITLSGTYLCLLFKYRFYSLAPFLSKIFRFVLSYKQDLAVHRGDRIVDIEGTPTPGTKHRTGNWKACTFILGKTEKKLSNFHEEIWQQEKMPRVLHFHGCMISSMNVFFVLAISLGIYTTVLLNP